MPRSLVFALLLALTACNSSDSGDKVAAIGPDPSGWKLASGKPPTKAEFAAVVASCEDRARGSFSGCLSDLGLRRSP